MVTDKAARSCHRRGARRDLLRALLLAPLLWPLGAMLRRLRVQRQAARTALPAGPVTRPLPPLRLTTDATTEGWTVEAG
jgi:hypothetical protein